MHNQSLPIQIYVIELNCIESCVFSFSNPILRLSYIFLSFCNSNYVLNWSNIESVLTLIPLVHCFHKALCDDTAEYHTAKSVLDFPQHVSTGIGSFRKYPNENRYADWLKMIFL